VEIRRTNVYYVVGDADRGGPDLRADQYVVDEFLHGLEA
jgi:hypothetical protein